MSTRSLTAAEDDTHIHTGIVHLIRLLKLDQRHTIGIGEERLDLFLIIHTLGGSTLFHLYRPLKSDR